MRRADGDAPKILSFWKDNCERRRIDILRALNFSKFGYGLIFCPTFQKSRD